jgi:hypothetical protein
VANIREGRAERPEDSRFERLTPQSPRLCRGGTYYLLRRVRVQSRRHSKCRTEGDKVRNGAERPRQIQMVCASSNGITYGVWGSCSPSTRSRYRPPPQFSTGVETTMSGSPRPDGTPQNQNWLWPETASDAGATNCGGTRLAAPPDEETDV